MQLSSSYLNLQVFASGWSVAQLCYQCASAVSWADRACCCRERSHATDFTAALSDHIGYLRRQEEARQMQEAFQAAQAGQQGPNLPTLDFRLKPGETVSLQLADKVENAGFILHCSRRMKGH